MEICATKCTYFHLSLQIHFNKPTKNNYYLKYNQSIRKVVGNGLSSTSGQPTIYDHNDEASNITHAAISNGELIIRDQDKQTQDINELSHDTENAHSKLKPIFNKEDERTRLNIVTSLKELGEQVKEPERTIHKAAAKDSQDGKMGNDFSKGVDSAVSIITGDMTGGLAGASAP